MLRITPYMEGPMEIRRFAIVVVAVVFSVAACTGTSAEDDSGTTELASTTSGAVNDSLLAERLDVINDAIATWRIAATIQEANAAAEVAANLVVGPNGPGYGDRNGDGVIDGAVSVGLLPGLDGTPAGLAASLANNECVAADVLGGSWIDPGERWGEMVKEIDDWRPDHNTMPSLASHPMRIVGWSTFTLESDSLDLAHEYAGHAQLHIDISLRALDC
jgi:hypothetical protein